MILPDDIVEHAISLRDQFFDLRGLAVYSSLGVGTLRDHIKSGNLPCFKVKGKILIKRSEFDQWMEDHRLDKKKDINDIVEGVLNEFKRP